jgi:hypothetical protein
MVVILIFIRIITMKYRYICAIIFITIYYVYYMYHVHVYSIVPKQIISVMNVTSPIVLPTPTLKDALYRDATKHYSYHKQTLSLFYMKRRYKR